METLNNILNELCNTILSLSKENSIEALRKYLDNINDKDAFLALSFLRNKNNEKIDLICAEYSAEGKGCQKNETEAGTLCAKIVTYLEKRNEFPSEYGKACFLAASLLYAKVGTFELNLGFAIDYDKRGAEKGNNEECRKRYETNIAFLRNLLPKKYENEETLYKVAAFVLDERDKRQVTDNYWNSLKEEALKTEKACFLKYFPERLPEISASELAAVDKILEKNSDFPNGSELYQKEQSKKSRPSLSVSGTTKTDIFSKVSIKYNEYEEALNSLKKTRLAAQRKTQHKEKLGIKNYEFWCSEEKIERALEVCRRKETYESVFGAQPSEFWENDAMFFKYMDAHSLKEKYKDVLGENNWDFWLDKEKVLTTLNEKEAKQKSKKEKTIKTRKLLIFILIFIVVFFSSLFIIKLITGLVTILTCVISAVISLSLTLFVGHLITRKAKAMK